MRSLKRATLTALFTAVALSLPTLLFAQDNVEKVAFDTVDQVKIQGVFYPSAKLKKAPAVMLIPKIGGNSTEAGWNSLALDLQKAGYAVLLFDFRGHGNSTIIQRDTFWNDQTNKKLYIGKFNLANPPETISIKDFNSAYYPQLVNDIMAAKTYLDKRNDGGDCNSSNMIIIGAEDGATLGSMWAYSEQLRYRVTRFEQLTPITPPQYVKDPTSMGSSISACIWLNVSPKVGTITTPLVHWTTVVGGDKNVPMAFVCGEKGTQDDKNNAKTLADKAKGKDGGKWTGAQELKGTDLKGSGLLSDKAGGRAWIVDTYLKKLMDEKAMPVWEEKAAKKSVYVWEFPRQNAIISKFAEEDPLRRAPTDNFLKP
jgi:hypothetical protein